MTTRHSRCLVGNKMDAAGVNKLALTGPSKRLRVMSMNVVITGANRGIGLALVKQYISRGCTVFGLCRQSSDALASSGATVVSGIDVGDIASLASLNKVLEPSSIDILINNAGVLKNESLGDINYSDILLQFEVNALGPLRVTEYLLDMLKPGAKVALITSRMGSIADNGSGGYYGYRMSKAALNAAGQSLAKDLGSRDIAVAILHPGFVQTDMVNHAGDISSDTAAERLSQRIDGLSLSNSGTFLHSNGEVLPW